MFVIVEIYNHAVIAHPEGDEMRFVNRDLAQSMAVAISAHNPGVYEVQPLHTTSKTLFDKRTHLYVTDRKDKLKVIACRQRLEEVTA